jgi:hypothetical protein
MVLVQISITPANNGTYIPINIVGMYNVRITGIQYQQGANDHRVIGIDNDKLRMISQFPYPIFLVNATTINGFGFDTSKEFHFKGVDFDGRIFINVINTADKAEPANFNHLVLTLDVDKC